MGIRTEVPPYHSTPIGAPSVYPIQLVEAYTVIANTGERVTPRAILKVEDADGRLLWETFSERQQVVEPAVAAIVRSLMRTALDNGSGYPARQPPYGLPYEVAAAGKTGTTNDATDVWFVGFTPDLLAAVWFGFDRPRGILPNAAGGVYAAPVWGRFMRTLYYGETPELAVPQPWPWPAGITTRLVDRTTGLLASTWCPAENAYEEYFVAGTEPTELCRPEQGIFRGTLRRLFGAGRDTVADSVPPDSASARLRRRRF
jgi:penicillin-binding protein 1A